MSWIYSCLPVVLLGFACASSGFASSVLAMESDERLYKQIGRIELHLDQWRIHEAKTEIENLLVKHSDRPVVQRMAAWVKYHLGEHRQALELFDRALVKLQNQDTWIERYSMVRAAAEIAKDWWRKKNIDGDVLVQLGPGSDRILVPYLMETVQRTLKVVGKDLGFRAKHPVLVEIIPDARVLSNMTGLSVEEIQSSGTIAVCKFGRLMITSPRATLKGFSWLDTVSHELVHMIISEKTRNQTPVWIHEALARYEDRRWRAKEPMYRKGLDPIEESMLAKAMAKDSWIRFERMAPSIAMLGSAEATALAFAELYTVADFLVARKGYQGIRSMLAELEKGSSGFQSIHKIYGLNKQAFISAWLDWLGKQRLRRLQGEPSSLEKSVVRKNRESITEHLLTGQAKTGIRNFFHLGQLLRARGRHLASVVEYQKAVGLAGLDHAALWILTDKLGLALMEIGKRVEAKKAFQLGLAIKPNNLEAHLHLGEMLLDTAPYQAWLHLREALRANPLDPRVHAVSHQAAEILSRKGDDREDWKEHKRRHWDALRVLSRSVPGASSKQQENDSSNVGAFLKIISRPWARVWIDYRDTGLTTPVYKLPVKPGIHLVGLVAGCDPRPEVVRVHVVLGETVVIERSLCDRSQ